MCKNCRQGIYQAWKGSRHANSTALSDPLQGTFYNKVVGDPTREGVIHAASGTHPMCLNCHAPNAAMDKTTLLDGHPVYQQGVNCIASHTLKQYNGIRAAGVKLVRGELDYNRLGSGLVQGSVICRIT